MAVSKSHLQTEDILSNSEIAFIKSAIAHGVRVDGRSMDTCRSLSISFLPSYGSVIVHLGATTIMTRVSCTVRAPFSHRPSEGFLSFHVEYAPTSSLQPSHVLSSSSYLSSSASSASSFHYERCLFLQRLLEKSIRDARAIDLEALVVIAGLYVWSVQVNVMILQDCGNSRDAALIAALTALAHFRRPDVTVSGTNINIHKAEERATIPLSLHHWPLPLTFAFFPSSSSSTTVPNISSISASIRLSDPSFEEEILSDGLLSVVVNSAKEVCFLQKNGGGIGLDENIIKICIEDAWKFSKKLKEKIEKLIKEDGKMSYAQRTRIHYKINSSNTASTAANSNDEKQEEKKEKSLQKKNIEKNADAMDVEIQEEEAGDENDGRRRQGINSSAKKDKSKQQQQPQSASGKKNQNQTRSK